MEYKYFDVKADRMAYETMLLKSGGQSEVPVIVDGGSVTIGFGGT